MTPPFPDLDPTGDAADDPLHDALAEWLGASLLADPDDAAWEDARFVAWLADAARAGDRAGRRATDAAFVARGEAMLARAQARHLSVHRFAAPPDEAAPEATPRPGRVRHVGPLGRAPARVSERARPYVAGGAPGHTAPLVELGVAAGPGRELWDEPPERWVRVPDALPAGEYLAFRIVGTSMSPMLRSGDVVLVRADGHWGEARPDRVVVARHPDDGYVCKRVRRAGPAGVELASLEPGHGPVRLPADARLVAGTVVAAWPGGPLGTGA